MEIFKNVVGFENLYQISNYGRVYSLKSGKFLKANKVGNGYLQIGLSKDNKVKNYFIHRLVAQAFIPNPLNLPQVNHISEIKTDNRVENLEWCSCQYNINYGSRLEKQLANPNFKSNIERMSKPVLQFTKDGEFVKEFPSTHEAERQTKINQANITKCCNCNKKYSHAGGYLWRYKEEEVA